MCSISTAVDELIHDQQHAHLFVIRLSLADYILLTA